MDLHGRNADYFILLSIMSDGHFRFCKFLEESELQWMEKILEKFYSQGGEEPVILMKTDEENKCHRVGIAAKDWPGIVEAVTGVYHDEGFNLHSLYADTLGENREVAILYARITDIPEEELKKLKEREQDIMDTLQFAARGNLPVRKLVGISSSKIQIFKRLRDMLNNPETRKRVKYPLTKEDYENITSEEGELFKFTFSRSTEYLRDRDEWTLINIILDSYWVQKAFLRDKKSTHVAIHQFTTRRGEKLTGITVAGEAKVVDLGRVLQILYNIVPNLVLKFSKYFVTREGAQVVRVEVTTKENEFLSEIQKKNISSSIKARISSLQRIQSFLEQMGPGAEVHWRIIAPRIAEEAAISGKPQMLLMLRSYDMVNLIYDLFVALPESLYGKSVNIVRSFTDGKEHGLLMKVHNPQFRKVKTAEGREALVISMRLNISPLNITSEKEIYRGIRNALEKALGTGVRDFDEGLRNINMAKLDRVMKIVRDHVPENDLKKLFYLYDEVLRLELEPEEIAGEIKQAYEIVRTYLENQETVPTIQVIPCGEKFHCVFAIDHDTAVNYLIQPLTEEARKEFKKKYPTYHTTTTLEVLGRSLSIVRFRDMKEAELFAENLNRAEEELNIKRKEVSSQE